MKRRQPLHQQLAALRIALWLGRHGYDVGTLGRLRRTDRSINTGRWGTLEKSVDCSDFRC
jgi:hypothetical protein